ncbi:MAG: ATP-dependent sacrificial sulfur transferase LarE [Deltaproteobacteria bacterium]|nr:ATP-dependent sacrificial sulfur transferase LarE [Deltaproteobacteria bacterium]
MGVGPKSSGLPKSKKGATGDRLSAEEKKRLLIAKLKKLDSLLVAFSGGVDSAFLLAAAHEALGKNVLAVTAVSPIHPLRERTEAIRFAMEKDIPHLLFSSHETDLPEFLTNRPDRCYHCKKALCQTLREIAKERDIHHVAHGVNVDDLDDFRPGLQAAVEAGIIAPLMDENLNKTEIRRLSKSMGLSQWDKPSMACLASRLPYGSVITLKKLKMIETAEAFLRDKGLKTLRVRHHGAVARIEVGASERDLILNDAIRRDIIKNFRHVGFDHIALDLEAFSSGKMNRSINPQITS